MPRTDIANRLSGKELRGNGDVAGQEFCQVIRRFRREEGGIRRLLPEGRDSLKPRGLRNVGVGVEPRSPGSLLFLLACLVLGTATLPFAEEPERGPEIRIGRAAGPISVDGDLSNAGWTGAARVDTWYETKPGENAAPKVRSAGYLAYDDRYLYAGFEFSNPDPSRIRAPYSDRDNITESIDYGGIVLDTRLDGRTGIMFLATPRGIQYDAVQDDASGSENASPDFYWSCAGRSPRTDGSWRSDPLLVAPVQRRGTPDLGHPPVPELPARQPPPDLLDEAPPGERLLHLPRAPADGPRGAPLGGTTSSSRPTCPPGSRRSRSGPGESPRRRRPGRDRRRGREVDPEPRQRPGSDPEPRLLPGGVGRHPDLRQRAIRHLLPREASLLPGGDGALLDPIAAVYTRTLTSPRWGVRATGKTGNTAYTAVVGEDRGGGTVIVPGPEYSPSPRRISPRAFALGRVRRDIGGSYVSFLFTDREIDGGGFNRVAGPDFQWRPNDTDVVNGQILYSMTETPTPRTRQTWNGREISGTGADFWWSHTTRTFDFSAQTKIFSEGFRADCGYVPQVGFRRDTPRPAHVAPHWVPLPPAVRSDGGPHRER